MVYRAKFMYAICCYRNHRALHSFPTRRSSDLQLMDRFGPDYWLGLEDRQAYPEEFVSEFEAQGFGHELLRVRLRSEEHTSELQSRGHLVCRLLLEKKKKHAYLVRSKFAYCSDA